MRPHGALRLTLATIDRPRRRAPPCIRLPHRSLSTRPSSEAADAVVSPNAGCVDARSAPRGFDGASAVVYAPFLNAAEGDALKRDVAARMARRRYERGHWDAVIAGYREVELPVPSDLAAKIGATTTDADSSTGASSFGVDLSEESQRAIERVRRHLEACHFDDSVEPVRWLPAHVIDLRKDGELRAHVDSVRFSGGIVAGVSLLSPAIMRLRPSADGSKSDSEGASGEVVSVGDTGHVDLYLPPLSLYVLSGMSRYQFSHEILPCGEVFRSGDASLEEIEVLRDHRLSIIFRDAK